MFSKANTKVLFSNIREVSVVLSKKQLHQLRDLQLKDNPRLELARDVFLFSFYLRGAELSAIAQLTDENIKDSYIINNKRTDGIEVRTLLEPEAKDLILKYKGMNDTYLFPILIYPTPAG